MSYRTIISMAAAAVLGIACVSTDALARGGARGGGANVGGVHAGGARVAGVHRGVRPGVAVGVGAAAVGAAAVRAPYYNGAECGYYPYPPCY